MNEQDIFNAINQIQDSSKLLEIVKYVNELIQTTDGEYIHESTEVINLSYGDKPIEIDDNDMGAIPWL